jgi:hypothetical protein
VPSSAPLTDAAAELGTPARAVVSPEGKGVDGTSGTAAERRSSIAADKRA